MEYNTKYIDFDNLAPKGCSSKIFPVVFPGFSRVSRQQFSPQPINFSTSGGSGGGVPPLSGGSPPLLDLKTPRQIPIRLFLFGQNCKGKKQNFGGAQDLEKKNVLMS